MMKLSLRLIFILADPASFGSLGRSNKGYSHTRRRTHQSACRLWFGGAVVRLGDNNLGITLQSMQAMLSRFGMSTDQTGLSGTNAAAVMVTADLLPFMKPGQMLDVTVSALGSASSLRGGRLRTPLLSARMGKPTPLRRKTCGWRPWC